MPHANHDSSEELLIREAIAGDKHAFGRLYEMYADKIYKYLFYRIGGNAEAADMTELVFLKAWENLPDFGSRSRGFNFRAWLYRIAHNTLVDHHRTTREEVALDAVPELASRAPHVQQLIEDAQEIETVMRMLDQLDAVSRQVIVLRFFSGLDSKETAEVLGMSAGNVRVIQYRALKKIRDLLGDEDE